jgi:hypothetical protein
MQCPTPHCVYLPLIVVAVPEIDVPSCRWPHISGYGLHVGYKWGDRLQSPGSLWRNAFEDGLLEWNDTPTLVSYYYINTYDADDDRRGLTILGCQGETTILIEAYGNIFYDIGDNYTVIQRRGIATHELGHGFSVGHIPIDMALLYHETPLSFFDTIYVPQPLDILLMNQVYP